MSYAIARGNRIATRRHEKANFRLKQLSEFYEPLAMLRMTSRQLRKSLPQTANDGSRWRLVHHIKEIKGDRGACSIVEAIIAINIQIEEILITKAGLLEGDRPASFDRFMHHSRLLKIAWDLGDEPIASSGTDQIGAGDVPFPDEIDDDLEAGRQSVKVALRALQEE